MIDTADRNTDKVDDWNATLNGDYLWSNVNFGEAVTDVMTPLTWSVIRFTLDDWVFIPGYPIVGNIGGYPYLNISIFATLFKMLKRSQADLLKYMEGTLFMRLPDRMEIPLIHLSVREKVSCLLASLKVQLKQRQGVKDLQAYLKRTPTFFQEIREKISAESDLPALYSLWQDEIAPHVKQGVWSVLGSATFSSDFTMQLRRDLEELVGSEDANLLIAKIGDQAMPLSSLGPMIGLEKLAAGEWSQSEYLDKYGHRGPHEFELSVPRPAEDSEWIEQQLENFHGSPTNVGELITRQEKSFHAALERFRSHHPRREKVFQWRITESSRRAILRENARSAYVRDRWLIRLFGLHVGELSGLRDDIFFLTLDEVLGLLLGDGGPVNLIPERKVAYQKFKEFPPLPSVIIGRFEPAEWINDPLHRSDIYHPDISREKTSTNLIKGSPGSAGVVEGDVRCLDNPEDGINLKEREILVAVQTDIAWTMLFPRAAGVITDVGAPLSHAAIVARELGIPAVVGCGDAMMRLKTGDRVRVNGSEGTVTILRRA